MDLNYAISYLYINQINFHEDIKAYKAYYVYIIHTQRTFFYSIPIKHRCINLCRSMSIIENNFISNKRQ